MGGCEMEEKKWDKEDEYNFSEICADFGFWWFDVPHSEALDWFENELKEAGLISDEFMIDREKITKIIEKVYDTDETDVDVLLKILAKKLREIFKKEK